jgi:hypothetical protein
MRPVGSIVDLLTWRLRLARTGLILRIRRLFSILVVFGGVGVALGYSVVARFSRDPDDDEAESRRNPE